MANKKINLNLPPYASAEVEFLQEVPKGIIAKDQFMQLLKTTITRHSGPVRVIENQLVLDQPMSTISHTFSFDFDITRNTKINEYIKVIIDYGNSVKDTKSKLAIDTVIGVTEKLGNNIKLDKWPNGWDFVSNWLENYPLTFDDEGNPNMPVLVMNEADKAKLKDEPPTPEQKRRREEVIERKRVEYFSKKRSRRLL